MNYRATSIELRFKLKIPAILFQYSLENILFSICMVSFCKSASVSISVDSYRSSMEVQKNLFSVFKISNKNIYTSMWRLKKVKSNFYNKLLSRLALQKKYISQWKIFHLFIREIIKKNNCLVHKTNDTSYWTTRLMRKYKILRLLIL